MRTLFSKQSVQGTGAHNPGTCPKVLFQSTRKKRTGAHNPRTCPKVLFQSTRDKETDAHRAMQYLNEKTSLGSTRRYHLLIMYLKKIC